MSSSPRGSTLAHAAHALVQLQCHRCWAATRVTNPQHRPSLAVQRRAAQAAHGAERVAAARTRAGAQMVVDVVAQVVDVAVQVAAEVVAWEVAAFRAAA